MLETWGLSLLPPKSLGTDSRCITGSPCSYYCQALGLLRGVLHQGEAAGRDRKAGEGEERSRGLIPSSLCPVPLGMVLGGHPGSAWPLPRADWARAPAPARNVCRESDPPCLELGTSGDTLIRLIQGPSPINIL